MNNIFVQSIKSLKTHWKRTFLASLGIMIGIASITVILSASESFENLIIDQMSIFGDDWVEVEVKHPMNAQALGANITTLKNDDAEAVLKVPNIKAGYYILQSQVTLSYQNTFKSVLVWAISEQYPILDKGEIVLGRFFTKEENDSNAKVIVIGKKIQENFFGDSDPLGQIIKVNNLNFKVIGVYGERGTLGGFFDMDEIVYMPVKTCQNLIMGVDHIQAIIAQVKDKKLISRTADDIRYLLQERHDVYTAQEEDFRVVTMDESIEILQTILNGVRLLLIAIASISLIVAGVGIMNVMYVSVSERTFEIGLRKAVGAKKGSILKQFLIEAIIITIFGGILGILFSMAVAELLTYILKDLGVLMNINVSFNSAFTATAFSIAVGLIFGIYPARKAAGLDPIQAIRKK